MWVDETRPLLQGARLTAWELAQDGISATLVTDSMAGWLMAQGKVDAVVTGADRIAANGDTANKIGTYGLAVLAARPRRAVLRGRADVHDRRVAAVGRRHPDRAPRPCRGGGGTPRPRGVAVYNPAFDVTPAELVSAIVTEHGVHRPPYRFG